MLYKYFDYLTLFLLSFLILFPKLPFIPVEGTYIQIRLEDFVVAGVYFLWVLGILFGRLKLQWGKIHTLIMILFLLGAVSTFLGYFVHYTITDPVLASLHVLRRLEYALTFFLMASSFKKENLKNYLAIILATAAIVTIYGLLALRFDLPQARTMGSPGTITTYEQVGFVQSTFGGHYDLGAFLMMTMLLVLSVILSLHHKKTTLQYSPILSNTLLLLLFLLFASEFILLQASFSRAAVIANALSLTFFFVMLKSWWTLLPAAHFVRVLYLYFTNRYSKYAYNLSLSFGPSTTPSLTLAPSLTLTPTPSFTPTPQPTLPPGVTPTLGPSPLPPTPTITSTPLPTPTPTPASLPGAQVQIGEAQVGLDVSGAMRASAWPKLIKDALTINPLFGQGYTSIGIGADGDYIRWLAEMGLVGVAAWFVTLGTIGWQLFNSFKKAADPLAKYIQLGILTAVVGLAVNAGLIDIFESSKIAFFFWTLVGIGVSLSLEKSAEIGQ